MNLNMDTTKDREWDIRRPTNFSQMSFEDQVELVHEIVAEFRRRGYDAEAWRSDGPFTIALKLSLEDYAASNVSVRSWLDKVLKPFGVKVCNPLYNDVRMCYRRVKFDIKGLEETGL